MIRNFGKPGNVEGHSNTLSAFRSLHPITPDRFRAANQSADKAAHSKELNHSDQIHGWRFALVEAHSAE